MSLILKTVVSNFDMFDVMIQILVTMFCIGMSQWNMMVGYILNYNDHLIGKCYLSYSQQSNNEKFGKI